MTSDTADLAARLAPLEERHDQDASQSAGNSPASNAVQGDGEFAAIVVDADEVNLSGDIVEKPREKTVLGMEPVVLAILGFMLVFIAFIAWQISMMPAE